MESQPKELIFEELQNLSAPELEAFCKSSKKIRNTCNDDTYMKYLALKKFPMDKYKKDYDRLNVSNKSWLDKYRILLYKYEDNVNYIMGDYTNNKNKFEKEAILVTLPFRWDIDRYTKKPQTNYHPNWVLWGENGGLIPSSGPNKPKKILLEEQPIIVATTVGKNGHDIYEYHTINKDTVYLYDVLKLFTNNDKSNYDRTLSGLKKYNHPTIGPIYFGEWTLFL